MAARRQEGDDGGEARRGLRHTTRRRTQSTAQHALASPQRDADEEDMAAMAKVWAHPEDLHMYLVRPPWLGSARAALLAWHGTAPCWLQAVLQRADHTASS